jgi:hypothetical protein
MLHDVVEDHFAVFLHFSDFLAAKILKLILVFGRKDI